MNIEIQLNTENAAFEDCAGVEIKRILNRLADDLHEWRGQNKFTIRLRDINGNAVGKCEAS